MDARRRRVQRELPDRDGHPAGTLVAEPEDPLVVGDDDEAHVLERALAEDLGDPIDIVGRDPGPAGPPDDVAELLARAPHRRRVDDRHEFLDVVGQQPVEQRRVAVLERGQPDVLLEGVVLDAQVLELEVDLLLDRQHPVGQQTAQPERVTLLEGEAEVLGQQPGAEQGWPGHGDPRRSPGQQVVEGGGQGTHPVEDSGRDRDAGKRSESRGRPPDPHAGNAETRGGLNLLE